MANIKIATITNHKRIDQEVIAAAQAAGDTLQVYVRNEYMTSSVTVLDYDDITASYKKGLKDAIDLASYQDEEDALVYTVAIAGNTHTMSGYERAGIESTGDPVTASDPLICVFSIAWLDGARNVLELPLTLKVGTALDTSEVSALAAKGITVSGTGSSFTISTVTPYQIQCVKPPLSTNVYVVQHDYDINLIRN